MHRFLVGLMTALAIAVLPQIAAAKDGKPPVPPQRPKVQAERPNPGGLNAKVLFNRLDTDKDGKLCFEEFAVGFRHMRQMMQNRMQAFRGPIQGGMQFAYGKMGAFKAEFAKKAGPKGVQCPCPLARGGKCPMNRPMGKEMAKGPMGPRGNMFYGMGPMGHHGKEMAKGHKGPKGKEMAKGHKGPHGKEMAKGHKGPHGKEMAKGHKGPKGKEIAKGHKGHHGKEMAKGHKDFHGKKDIAKGPKGKEVAKKGSKCPKGKEVAKKGPKCPQGKPMMHKGPKPPKAPRPDFKKPEPPKPEVKQATAGGRSIEARLTALERQQTEILALLRGARPTDKTKVKELARGPQRDQPKRGHADRD